MERLSNNAVNARRRTVLRAMGLLTAGGLAGCNQDGSSSESTAGDDADPPTSTATGTDVRSEPDAETEETATETEPLPENAKLAPEGLGRADKFGLQVAVSGDGSTVLVSALGEDERYTDPGQAFVFRAEGGEWRQQARFTADEEDHGALFGHSVALNHDGSVGLVGCPTGGRTDDAVPGNVYVVAETDGGWDTETKLTSAVGKHGERFGTAVALAGDGETALVTSNHLTEEEQKYEGWAQILTKDGESWTHSDRFTADDREDDDMFGLKADLSADGSTALVGAPEDDNEIGEHAGAGYVFSRSGEGWAQQAKLVPDGASGYSNIGDPVALSADGTEAFLGDWRFDHPTGDGSGAVHVFGVDGSTWSQRATMHPETEARTDKFGNSLAVSADGTTALVDSAFGYEVSGDHVSAVHVMERRDGSWRERERIGDVAGRHRNDGFGDSVSLSADGATGAVGAQKDAEVGFFTGAAYVLQL